ncbi:TcfC E-set like domain-containing protein [Endozoicomonas ascidiicola]|uniref:TcfC E-set like domain-containing protein n=1 Tax=Endozoicomonas ascidiicola TaxID=1698521 RepID=UPI00082C704D|nr:TcfC E-set like domain-containing protein [Endozoicomonas ascidiicola]
MRWSTQWSIKQKLFTVLILSTFSITLSYSLNLLSYPGNGRTQDASPIFLAALTPPVGFETLTQSGTNLADVYYGNRYLTSQLIYLTPGLIELSNPEEVVQLIGDVNDPDLIISALTGPLNSHPELTCSPTAPDFCTLIPPVAGVTYDESAFRVDVFVNRRFMQGRAAEVLKYLPPSDAGFALMQNISASASGFNSDSPDYENSSPSYTFNGLTMASWKENSLFWEWSYSDVHDFSVRHLFAQRDFQGMEYSAGLMNSRGNGGLNFLVNQPLFGVRTGSSENTRKDLEFSRGIPVEVYLPVRGWVEVRENDRLLYSAPYEAGAQRLDTSSFPNGAYDIEIRIISDSGYLISSEARFFAKQSQLPPLGEWLFMAEAGRVVDASDNSGFPNITDDWQARGSASRRLSDTLAATGSVSLGKHEQLVEIGAFFFNTHYQFSPSVMLADDGSKGLAVNGLLLLGPLTVSGNYRRLWYDHLPDRLPNKDALKLNDQTDIFERFGRSVNQQSLSTAFPLFQGSLGYRYNLSQSYDLQGQLQAPERSHYMDCRQNLFRSFDYDGDIVLSLGKNATSKTATLTFYMRYRTERWSFQAAPRAEIQKEEGSVSRTEKLRLSAGWNSRSLTEASIRFDAGLETGGSDNRLDSSLEFANRLGRVSASANHGRYDEITSTAWSVNLSSRLLTNGNMLAVGGEDLTESALVVNVTGRNGDVFDVKVNQARRSYAVVGKPSVITLPPYEQYQISLSPAGKTLYLFDEREKNVTLYPGNVVTLDYQATPLLLVYGRLLLNGKPLSNAAIRAGDNTGDTDDLGLFQLEVPATVKSLNIAFDKAADIKAHCQLPLTVPDTGYLLQLGSLDLADYGCGNDVASRLP